MLNVWQEMTRHFTQVIEGAVKPMRTRTRITANGLSILDPSPASPKSVGASQAADAAKGFVGQLPGEANCLAGQGLNPLRLLSNNGLAHYRSQRKRAFGAETRAASGQVWAPSIFLIAESTIIDRVHGLWTPAC